MYPYLLYCIEVWGSASKGQLNSWLKLQKRAVRLIKSVPFRTESSPLFKSLSLLTVNKLFVFKIGMVMFKIYADKVPNCLKKIFKKTSDVHDKDTRQKHKLYLPFPKLGM